MLCGIAWLAGLGGLTASAASPLPQGGFLGRCEDIDAPGVYRLSEDLKAGWDCIHVRSSNVVLDCDGKSIVGDKYQGAGVQVAPWGPDLRRPENVEIRNCTISHFQYGIHVVSGRSISIHHNDLSGNYDDTNGSYFGRWMGEVDGGGLQMVDTAEGVVEENTANRQANGIDLRDSRRIVVRNNTTSRNSAFGIMLWNTSDSEIVSNRIEDNYRWCLLKGGIYDGWVVQGCDAAGILLQDGSSRNVIRGNSVLGQNGDGIYIKAPGMRCGDGNQVLNNRIIGALWNSVEAGFCDGITVAGNEIVFSKIGVWISFMEHVTLRDNVIRDQEEHGVALKNVNYATITGNEISGSPEGVFLNWDPSQPELATFLHRPFENYTAHGNVVQGNHFRALGATGVHVLNANGNLFGQNRFSETQREYWFEGNATDNRVVN